MTPIIYEQLVETLRHGPLRLEKLHGFAHDAGSGWSIDQLLLMLTCMDGIEVNSVGNGDTLVAMGRRSKQEELAEAIIDVLQAQGRALPAAQVMQLLPGRFTTSTEQIKKLARETTGLKVIGPGLISLDK